MLRLILAFVDIAVHRRGPDHLPSSTFFFGTLLAIAYLLEVAMLRTVGIEGVARPLLLGAFWMACDMAFLWSVLKAFGRERRFRQTASATLGIDGFFLVTAMLLTAWRNALGVSTTVVTPPDLLWLGTQIWSIDITAFVLSRATERPYAVCVAIVLGYVLLWVSVRQLFVPVQVAP